ncbi:MAG: hypothetical protein HY914_01335 [Desulfomonile tiedjei]|nr:hypothetical protein [Desulfomonile tiedjei]
MKGAGAVLSLVLVLTAIPLSSMAWEFSVQSEYEMRYRYISRTGPNDLFGNADYAQTHVTVTNLFRQSSIGLAGPNNRYVQAEGYSSKGADAAYHEMRLWVYPRVAINPAITLRGHISFQGNLNGNFGRLYSPERQNRDLLDRGGYYIGPSENWATNPHYSGWIMPESRDVVAGVPIAVPTLNALWITIQSPWGFLVYGRRPAGFGMGWVSHEKDNYATGFSIVVPYGALRFSISQYLHDAGEDTDPNNDANVFDRFLNYVPFQNEWPITTSSAVDQNKVADWNQAAALTYQSGNFDMGSMVRVMRWSNVHGLTYNYVTLDTGQIVPLGSLRDDALYPNLFRMVRTTGAANVGQFGGFMGDFARQVGDLRIPVYGDMFFLLATAYLKYTDGRFFLNAEYGLQNVEIRRKGARPISGWPQAWAIEAGAWGGPLKLSLAHFYRSGHDVRGGTFDPVSRTGAFTRPEEPGRIFRSHDRWNFFLTRWGGGQAPMAPYSFLLPLYGGGNNSYNSAGNCTFQDFLSYALRVDYAVAANLNLFGTVMRAQRASNTGSIKGMYSGIFLRDRDMAVYPNLPFEERFGPVRVPDNDLGLELGFGMDWRLLENLTFRFLFSHWQPGNWFKWAYQDVSRPAEPISFSGGRYCNPGRTIDALVAIQSGFLVDF